MDPKIEVERKRGVKMVGKENNERIAFLNEQAEELSIQQEEELVTDYDAALKEYQTKNKPYKVKFKGQIFEVPHSIPFSFSLFYMRHCIKKQGGTTVFVIPDDKQSEFIERMFGKRFLKVLEQSDDVELNFVFSKLVPDIMDKWGYSVKNPKNE